jgi:two-component system response regulator VicR
MKQHILLLEDDPNLGFVLQEHLELSGFAVTLKTNGEEGLTAVQQRRFDLCLVDVMMPKKDGFTFARELRAKDTTTPLIFLTAKSLKEDRIEGFEIGGDDYITKPFSMEELLLRIRAVLKRTAKSESQQPRGVQVFASFTLDAERQILRHGRASQALTSKESEVLALLCDKKNSLVGRSNILRQIWGDDSVSNGRSLDVFISKLRKYLALDPTVEIRSVHGRGYKLTVVKDVPPKKQSRRS